MDIEDVVLNRRILVVLLPALQKAPEEMRNCGKIVVAMLKMMMGRAAGSMLEGSKLSLVDARPTRSPSPFIAILDEAGYYMVKGIDTMMAQARSLGFMIIIAGQDMAAMQSVAPQIAETVAANARLTAAGATEDAQRPGLSEEQVLNSHVPVVRPTAVPGCSDALVERPDVLTVEIGADRDLQRLLEGEFYSYGVPVGQGQGVSHPRAGAPWIPEQVRAIRGPTQGTGLDQSKDIEILAALRLAASHH